MLGGIRDLDAAQIAEPYRPLIDGEEWADQPLMLFQQGKWHTEKPVIIGTNFEEMSYVSAVLNEALPGGLGKRLFEVSLGLICYTVEHGLSYIGKEQRI